MTEHATWEGGKVSIARVKNGKVILEPFIKGRLAAMMESQKHPIGLIIEHQYDTGGRGGSHIHDYSVYYKGGNVEAATPDIFEHPKVRILENFLSNLGDQSEDGIPHTIYERPDIDQYDFRKKKTASKPKRKPKKVVKKCKCK